MSELRLLHQNADSIAMPIRVGIDLVSVEEVLESITSHGDRYLRRVYSEQEISDSTTVAGVAAQRLAARFAAKEATMKVLGVGDHAIGWRDIEVTRNPAGAVGLLLSGAAANLAGVAGIAEIALSLAHEQGFAAAIVVAQVQGGAGE